MARLSSPKSAIAFGIAFFVVGSGLMLAGSSQGVAWALLGVGVVVLAVGVFFAVMSEPDPPEDSEGPAGI